MIRFAVIGAGRMGSAHIRNLAKGRVKNTVLVAVCDIDQASLDKVAKNYKDVKTYRDYKEMLEKEKLDGVLVVTPHYSHSEIACFAIEHKVNTLIEKPLSVTTLSGAKVIEAKRRNPEVVVGVSYNQRSDRTYAKAKELVSAGAIGKLIRANLIITDWYRSQAYYNQGGWRASYNGEGGGVLINQCVHQLDVLQWIIGMPKSIVGEISTINRKITVENDVTAIFEYDGFNCSFSASTHELYGTNRLEIVGEKGKIIVDKRKMTYYVHDMSEPEVNSRTEEGYGRTGTKKRKVGYGRLRLLKDSIFGQQLRSVNAFCSEIEKRGKQLAPVEEGNNALSLINGIYLSAWTGERVTLPLNGELYENWLNKKKEEEKRG